METRDTTTTVTQPNQGERRKPYQKPRLEVYGDLTEITQSLTGSGMNDGSGHPNMHFTS